METQLNDFAFIKLMLISVGVEESLINEESKFMDDMHMDIHTINHFMLMIESFFCIAVDLNITPVQRVDQLQKLIANQQFIKQKFLTT